jgi:IclR family transcriptional regulator, pca regulon regulatory protein
MPLPPRLAGEPAGQPPAEAVTPLIRGTAVLRALTDADDGALSLPELERVTGLARSTLDRITATLTRMGYLRTDGRALRLAPPLMELGNAYLAAVRLPELLGPYARQLADELRESVSLAVPDGDGIRFIHQTTRRRTLSVSFRVGDLLPAERTAPGPLIAADWNEQDWTRWRQRRATDPGGHRFPALPPRETAGPPTDAEFASWANQAGRRGWALDDQLIEPGLVALSVPVHHPDGTLACVASLVSHTSRYSAHDLRERLLPRLRQTVTTMEQRLDQALPPPEPGPGAAPAPAGRASRITASKQELGRGFIESLARGLTVLTAFDTDRQQLTLAAIARAAGQARATTRRALITLQHLGYVVAESGTFRLTPRVLALGYPPLSRLRLPHIARPHLAALSERVHDSASLAVLDGHDVRYTARVPTRRIISVDITVGTRLPAYATSMGRVLLADLPPNDRTTHLDHTDLKPLTPHTITDPDTLATLLDHIAEAGYALVDQELEEGLRSIAVPIRDHAGHAVAAINIAMHTGRHSLQECVTRLLPELRTTAHAIAADLHIANRFTPTPTA